MLIFAAKHFEGSQARFFNLLIRIAIYARASLSVVRRIVKRTAWPVFEGVALHVGLYVLLSLYANYAGIQYDQASTNFTLGIYSVVWVFFLWLFGGYDKPWIPRRVIQGIAMGSIVLFAGYGLLPEELRFSRAILLFGAGWFSAVVILGRVTMGGWRLGAKPNQDL